MPIISQQPLHTQDALEVPKFQRSCTEVRVECPLSGMYTSLRNYRTELKAESIEQKLESLGKAIEDGHSSPIKAVHERNTRIGLLVAYFCHNTENGTRELKNIGEDLRFLKDDSHAYALPNELMNYLRSHPQIADAFINCYADVMYDAAAKFQKRYNDYKNDFLWGLEVVAAETGAQLPMEYLRMITDIRGAKIYSLLSTQFSGDSWGMHEVSGMIRATGIPLFSPVELAFETVRSVLYPNNRIERAVVTHELTHGANGGERVAGDYFEVIRYGLANPSAGQGSEKIQHLNEGATEWINQLVLSAMDQRTYPTYGDQVKLVRVLAEKIGAKSLLETYFYMPPETGEQSPTENLDRVFEGLGLPPLLEFAAEVNEKGPKAVEKELQSMEARPAHFVKSR